MVKVGSVIAQVFTSPHATEDLDPEAALLSLLAGAKTSIYVGIYSLTLANVAQSLISAHSRGVTVQVVADATEAKAPTSQITALAAAGVDVHVWGANYRLAHFKVAVVDGARVAFGSYNWSGEAELDDYEVFAIFTGVEVTRGGMATVFTNQIKAAYAAGKPLAAAT